MKRPFQTFLGVSLGGGRGKNTAVARLAAEAGFARVLEVRMRSRAEHLPFYDDVLLRYLQAHSSSAVLAIDAPLTTTACVGCRLPVCRTLAACEEPTIVWFRDVGVALGDRRTRRNRNRPSMTPYTQRACEVLLQHHHGVAPRETLGQGTGPLTARAAYLRRALEDRFRLNENLLEVYPKATLRLLFGHKAHRYKRHPDTWLTRAEMLQDLADDLRFEVWREGCLRNDHSFDAVIAAFTAYLWARDGWEMPHEHRAMFEQDGWIWLPPP